MDTCQFQTIIEADVPRVNCPEHGICQVTVDWADQGSRFTALMESFVISWLQEASISAVARLLRLTWKEVDGVMQRAVKRGLKRRESLRPERIGVDETSFRKRHEYVTVVADLDTKKVLSVIDDRSTASLQAFYKELNEEQLSGIKVVSMDMHAPYMKATAEALPDGLQKIAFDKFHVAGHLGKAVDQVRRAEHKELMAQNDETLKKSKYLWLYNPQEMPDKLWRERFERLQAMDLRTARAWRMKEFAMWIWEGALFSEAKRQWRSWHKWVMRSRLEPMKSAAKTIQNHLHGILFAMKHGVTNALSESLNAVIQKLKKRSNGFRSRPRYKTAILFNLGGLDLRPDALFRLHTKS